MVEDIFKSDEAYYADREHLSNSALKLLRESPTKFHLWRTGKWRQPDTAAFDMGKAVHSIVLEGIDNAVVCEVRKDQRTKAYQKLLLENKGKLLLSQSEYRDYLGMSERLQNNSEVQALMLGGRSEVPQTGTYNGLKFKGKADMLVEKWDDDYIVDLKTTAKSIDDFKKSAKYLLYNQQAALYSHLFEVERFVFVVVEKSWPYEIGIFECSQEFMDSGYQELNRSIKLYEDLFVDGHYTSNYARRFTL
jgi:hypothetical protein